MSSKQITVTDSASGNPLTVDIETYVGDLPSDYGYANDGENVTWVNYDYAAHGHDPMYDVEGVPEGQPLWTASA